MLEYGEEIKAKKEPLLEGHPFGRPKIVQTWAVGGQGETLGDFEEFIQKLQGFKTRVTESFTAGEASKPETTFKAHPAVYERPTEIKPPVRTESNEPPEA